MREGYAAMKRPKTLAQTPWAESRMELLVLYVLTTVASAMLFDLHWTLAMVVAPGAMLALLIGVAAFVQALWMLVVGMERLGTLIGIRKSPLA